MATLGCTNPNAVNYNPLADQDNGTCVYLAHVDDVCYAFQDEPTNQLVDQSFTLSYSIKGGIWVFYHDYVPDYYFHTRSKLHNLSNAKVRIHNDGPPGVFLDTETKPFFIDVVIKANPNAILNSIAWLSEVFDTGGGRNLLDTITHVTIWNDQQCTGRIPLTPFQNITQDSNSRFTRSHWIFNEIKNQVIDEGSVFLNDLFGDFLPIPEMLDGGSDRSWYEIDYLRGDYFILRLETDNISQKQVLLHDYNSDITQDARF